MPPSIRKPNLICIVPPYNFFMPPHGAACLMGYLKANGCFDFDFLDLRLWTSDVYMPTYRPVGVFGESFVVDVPDLPVVLRLLRAFDEGQPFRLSADDEILVSYCLDRGINPGFLIQYLSQLDRFLERSFGQMPDLKFVGFSTWSTNLLTTLMAAAHLKRRARPPFIVLGGPQVTESLNSARLALKSGLADAIVRGEGEVTLLELYNAVSRGAARPQDVAGCMTLDPGTGDAVMSDRPLMRMQAKPLPDFDCMPVAAYQKHTFPGTLLPFEISRGCTDKCTFCSEWVFWKHFRPDSVEHVIDQLTELKRRYHADGFCFSDSLLNGVKNRLVGLAEAILASGLRIHWSGYMRADIDEETAKLVTRAGCQIAVLGIESLSDETLKLMNKRRVRADNINALGALLNAGITLIVAGIIPGFPGDTTERFVATARGLHELQLEHPLRLRVNVEPFIVSPGQPLAASLAQYGLAPHGWSEPVLDIAPRYRAITSGVTCAVTGANQGIHRIGQLRIANTINSFNPIVRQRSQDPYMYGPVEDLSDAGFAFSPVAPGWLLAEFKGEHGGRSALLVSPDEQERWERESIAAVFNGSIADTFASHRDRWRAAHLVHDLAVPDLTMGLTTRHVPDDAEVALSPFAVCRRIEESGQLLVADFHARSHALVDLRFAPLVTALKGRRCSPVEFGRLAAGCGASPDAAAALRGVLAGARVLVVSRDEADLPGVALAPQAAGVLPLQLRRSRAEGMVGS